MGVPIRLATLPNTSRVLSTSGAPASICGPQASGSADPRRGEHGRTRDALRAPPAIQSRCFLQPLVGTAIDLKFGPQEVDQGEHVTQRAFLSRFPIFNQFGRFWGVGFSDGSVDRMHFEVAEEAIARMVVGGLHERITRVIEPASATHLRHINKVGRANWCGIACLLSNDHNVGLF
jgi:hypothetical protein